MQNARAVWRRRVLDLAEAECHDYTIVVPVYGDPRYFAGRRRIEPYKPNVIVACDVGPHAMKDFAAALEREGWRVHRSQSPNPTAPALIRMVLDSGAVTT